MRNCCIARLSVGFADQVSESGLCGIDYSAISTDAVPDLPVLHSSQPVLG